MKLSRAWRHSRGLRDSKAIFLLLLLVPAAAHAQGGWLSLRYWLHGTSKPLHRNDRQVASLIAIVIGGYGFAHGEPGAKKTAERYLEQYGDPIVMDTYLKVTIMVLAAISVVLAGLVYRSQRALAEMHPMIVRINDVGRARSHRLSEFTILTAGGGEQVLPVTLGRALFQPQSLYH